MRKANPTAPEQGPTVAENRLLDHLAEHGWAVSDDAVDTVFWKLARDFLDERAAEMTPAAIGLASRERADIRGDRTLWLEPGDPHPTASLIEVWLEHQRRLFNRELRLGLRRVESHFALYPAGAGYDLHLDQPPGHTPRKITFILYLNDDWRPEDGGELELHLSNTEPPRIISPLGGRLVLFRSELFPHRVLLSRRPRKSLTGWFRDDDP